MSEERLRERLLREKRKALVELAAYLGFILIVPGLIVWLAPYALTGGEPEPRWLYSVVKLIASIGMGIGILGLILGGAVFGVVAKAGSDATAVGIGTVIWGGMYDRGLRK